MPAQKQKTFNVFFHIYILRHSFHIFLHSAKKKKNEKSIISFSFTPGRVTWEDGEVEEGWGLRWYSNSEPSILLCSPMSYLCVWDQSRNVQQRK